jgi:class 3 adenylate cyclase
MLEDLGGRIRKRREERGLKQADIANALQVSAQAVSKWERGENAPDISLLSQLSRLLEVSTDWLLGLHDSGQEVFEASVLVSGVLGYAIKSRDIGPRELADWANGFFYHLTESVVRRGGVPVKQMGDGLLCFFSGQGHENRAVEAASKAVAGLEERLNIAIASGEIYLGSIGHPDYSQLDIIGNTVNVAFRLLEHAASEDEASIIVTENVANTLEPGMVAKGPQTLRLTFIPESVTVYSIVI